MVWFTLRVMCVSVWQCIVAICLSRSSWILLWGLPHIFCFMKSSFNDIQSTYTDISGYRNEMCNRKVTTQKLHFITILHLLNCSCVWAIGISSLEAVFLTVACFTICGHMTAQKTKCFFFWHNLIGMYRISGAGWPDIRPFFAIRFRFWPK